MHVLRSPDSPSGALTAPTVRTVDGARITPALVEARRPGEVFPRVRLAGVELTRDMLAGALWVSEHEIPFRPCPADLQDAVRAVLGRIGVTGVKRLAADFRRIDVTAGPSGDRSALRAWGRAHQLCLRAWYRGMYSHPLVSSEAAVLLYASSIVVRPRRELDAEPDRDAYLLAHLHEGAQALAGVDLGLLAEAAQYRHLGPALADRLKRDLPPDDGVELCERLMPDRRRSRFCFDVARDMQDRPLPLVVLPEPDDDVFALGLVPPPCPAEVAWYAKFLPNARPLA